MKFKKKFGTLIVLLVVTVLFTAGCDSGNLSEENTGTTVFDVNDEVSLNSALEDINSGDNIVFENSISGDNFQLAKSSGTYNFDGRNIDGKKSEIAGNLRLGTGETIDIVVDNIDFNDNLFIDIGEGDLDLNNVSANNIIVESAGTNSIKINALSKVENMRVKGENIRIVVTEDTVVKNLEIETSGKGAVIDGKGSIENAVINAENVNFNDILPGHVSGDKKPGLPDESKDNRPGGDDESEKDSNSEEDDEDENLTDPEEELDLTEGYINFYMKSDNLAAESVNVMNNSNKPDKTGKPGDGNSGEVSEINVIIDRIEFNDHDGSGWQEWKAFSGPEKVNLLSDNLHEEFNIEGEAEVGSFDRLRIFVSAEYDESVDEGEKDEANNGDTYEETDENDRYKNNNKDIDDEDEKDGTDDSEENRDFNSISHVVYENGDKEVLSVNAASNAGVKIKGDFSVEGGMTTELELGFAADELINMRGPQMNPMLMPKSFQMDARQSGSALAVKIENYVDLEDYSIELIDGENSYSGNYIEKQEGWYLFTGLNEGDYTLVIDADGYELLESEITIVEGEKKEIAVSLIPLEEDAGEEKDNENDGDKEETNS